MLKKILILFAVFTTTFYSAHAFEMSDSQVLVNPLNSTPEIQAYSLEVGKKIIANFTMPNTQENLATIVVFKVDKSGKLISYEISQTSGNQDYDNRVIQAVKKSSPYPIPKFQEATDFGVVLNMDLSIIRLIKMLSGDLNPKQLQPETKQPQGKKFINPYDLEQ